jgi:ribosomal protein L40E
MPAVVCSGCGWVFDPPSSYRRKKIPCPQCGVICSIPDDASPAQGSLSETAPAAAAWPAATVDGSPSAASEKSWWEEPEPVRESNTTAALIVPGLDEEPARDQPSLEIPKQSAKSVVSGVDEPIPNMELEEEPHRDQAISKIAEQDDDSPYLLRDQRGSICPKCRSEMQPKAQLCLKCGYNQLTLRQVRRRFEPMQREWESERSLGSRLGLLASAQAFHFFLGWIFFLGFDTFVPAIIAWFPLTALLVFLLGTYDHILLKRDSRGRVKLVKTWRVCFIPLEPVVTNVRSYEGVVYGPWREPGFLEWGILLMLLFWGLLPGLIWYYNVFMTPQYMVALARNHGNPEVFVYRGRNVSQMNEMVDALVQMAGLARLV